MAAYIGTHKIDKCYLGTQEIDKVMLGAHEVCSSAVADKPLTGGAADFLVPLTEHHYSGVKPAGWDRTMESLPEDEAFPDGQMMPIIAHGIEAKYVQRANDAGFTAGYWQNSHGYSATGPVLDAFAALTNPKMKYMGYLRSIPNGSFDLDSGSAARAVAEVNDYKNDHRISGRIYGWVLPYDDHTITFYKNRATIVDQVNDAIYAVSPLPIGTLGTGDTVTPGTYVTRQKKLSILLQQSYPNGAKCNWKDSDGTLKQFETHKSLYLMATMLMDVAEKATPRSGKPHLTPLMDGPFCYHHTSNANTDDPSYMNNAYYKKELIHNALLAMMGGCNSYWLYQFHDSYMKYCGATTGYVAQAIADLFDFVTLLKNSKLDKAFLWGKGASPVTMRGNDCGITNFPVSGWMPTCGMNPYVSSNTKPITAAIVSGEHAVRRYGAGWGKWDLRVNKSISAGGTQVHADNQFTYRDIHLSATRFIVATNSIPQPDMLAYFGLPSTTNNGVIRVRFSGFPHDGTQNQLKVTDLLTGATYTPNASGQIDVDIQPLGSVILKVGPADGYAGGDTPQPAPAITTHPHSLSLHVGDAVPTLTVGYTPPTASVQWEFKNTGDWQDIPGATSANYTMHDAGSGVTIGQNGDNFRARVTTSGNTPVHSNTAIITVT